MNLIFHREAYEEMLESARFYESKSEGLGSDFLDAVEATTRRILARPTLAQSDKATIRRRLVPGFRSQFFIRHIKTLFLSPL